MTNKATMDSRVAEIMGWKLIETEGGLWAWVSKDNEGDYVHEALNNEYPFISAPTYETDGIVQAWIKEQFGAVQQDVILQMRSILTKRCGVPSHEKNPYTQWDIMDVQFGEVGDIAHALLAVGEERDG